MLGAARPPHHIQPVPPLLVLPLSMEHFHTGEHMARFRDAGLCVLGGYLLIRLFSIRCMQEDGELRHLKWTLEPKSLRITLGSKR